MADNQRSRVPMVAGITVLVLAVAIGGFLYLTRDTSSPPLELSKEPTGTGTTIDPATLDGSWTVVAGRGADATVAGYRVKEVFAAGARKNTADGRTDQVKGLLTVAGGSVTEGSITVDMTTLASDLGRRDGALKSRGLQTDTFPAATLVLTAPIALPALTDGKTFTVTATGDLTLHGVTRSVTIDLEGRATGDKFTVQGSAPIAMADYDIEAPSVGGFVEVEGTGSFEFIVNFQHT